jgi:CubicO group peptidase (beta-lactamase class C family)
MSHRMKRREFLLATGAAALSAAPLPPTAPSQAAERSTRPEPLEPWKPLVADLEKQVAEPMREFKVPGLSIAVVRDGKPIWRRGFGVKQAGGSEPVDTGTVFEVASVSKTVFAYAVVKLAENGVLDLDTPLTKYTPDRYLEGDPRLDLITARHVLTHTTGFQNWRSSDEPLTIHFTPGEKFSYSGEGYSYLQSVVTHLKGHVNPEECDTYERGLKVCATDIDAYMRANLLAPFGMDSSGYVWNDALDRNAAQPHDEAGKPTGKRKPRAVDAARYASAGGLQTTPSDYARFLIEVIDPRPRDSFRLGKTSRADMLRPQVKINDTYRQALGWHVKSTGDGDLIFHGGGNPGFSAFVAGSLARKSGVVLAANSDSGYQAIGKLIDTDTMQRLVGFRMSFPLF